MDAAVARLFTANNQWADAVRSTEPTFFQQQSKGQAPKVLWIGCADSRVPESVVTASKPGDIFVHRNIANQFHLDDDSALSVLTYAIDHLGVEHVIIVGHTHCGGAAACYEAALAQAQSQSQSPSQAAPEAPTTPLARWLAPLTALVASLRLSTTPAAQAMPLIVEENVRAQVANVVAAPPLQGAWADPARKKVWVHGWVYEVENGTLKDLGVTQGPPALQSAQKDALVPVQA
ncbi:carbonic anhydrase [Dentipellis sp. KUC8613]|nr:carbonic anhydrase [Dentipellis sp. KUC8613]